MSSRQRLNMCIKQVLLALILKNPKLPKTSDVIIMQKYKDQTSFSVHRHLLDLKCGV